MSHRDRGGTYREKRVLSNQGFTLVELLVAMVMSLIIMGAIYSSYSSQQASYLVQEQVSETQQNLRGVMDTMEREIRMAGYDPGDTGNFGITDIKLDAATGYWRLQFEADFNENGTLDGDEAITYSLVDVGTSGDRALMRDDGGGPQLLAENIQWVGFAYAYDSNGDGELDFHDTNGNGQRDAGEPVIWAIDTDGDNQLDLNLDTNNDGVIDENDDTDSDGLIDGQALGVIVPMAAIRAVKIWVLARTGRPMRGYIDTKTYVVGDQLMTPGGAFRYRLLTTSVRCRNQGL